MAGFSWVIEDKLAGMDHPGERPRAFARLKAEGVGAVVTLTERPLPLHLVEQHGLAYLHLPIPNFAPPQPDQVFRFIEFCEQNIQTGRAVAAHCLAGCGRTGTMLACYLVWQGTEPTEAIRMLRTLRPCSIETFEQEMAIFDLAARLSEQKETGN